MSCGLSSASDKSLPDFEQPQAINTPVSESVPKVVENRFTVKIASSIFFLDPKRGWSICKGRKALCASQDGGSTWYVVANSTMETVSKFFFVDPETGFLINDLWTTKRSNTVGRTTDGGQTWKEVLEVPSPISALNFSKDKYGMVSARSLPFYITDNGGVNWKETRIQGKDEVEPLSIGGGIIDLTFVSANNVWGYGGGIWYSTDRGMTWENKIDSKETQGGLINSSFIDQKTGWIVGSNSQAWRLNNNTGWERIDISEKMLGGDKEHFTFYRVSFISSKEGWIIVHPALAQEISTGRLIHTKDGGKTWEIIYKSEIFLRDIIFLDSHRGFATDDNGDLLHTLDGGRTWETQTISNN
jgi:photosystem II stability/assembly factor-like uncharacterized protein